MKTTKLILCAALLIGQTAAWAQPAPSFSTASIKNEYRKLFKATVTVDVDAEGNNIEEMVVTNLPAKDVWADLANKRPDYLDYLRINYSLIDHEKLSEFEKSPEDLNNFFIAALQRDTLFGKFFSEMAYYYLKTKGSTIKGYKPQAKLKMKESELMDIAAKFFYAPKVKKDGQVLWKVCVGGNAYNGGRIEGMKPLVEAFLYMAVLKNLENDKYDYDNDFLRAAKAINDKNKDINDKSRKLDVMRDQMQKIMVSNADLKKAIWAEYEACKGFLNFEIVK